MRFRVYSKAILALLSFFSLCARAELQNDLSVSAPALYPGDAGAFTASSTSGPSASALGTKTFTYSGHMKYSMGFGDGRYTGAAGSSRYGVAFDSFEHLQSFISPLFQTVLNSNTTCPGSGNYNWVGTRFRNHNITRGAQDPTATNFYAAGTVTYVSSTGAFYATNSVPNLIDLAGPTATTASFTLDRYGLGCSGGSYKTYTTSSGGLSPTPFDAFGTLSFGANSFTYISAGGNPLVMVGFSEQTVDASFFAGINSHVFSGIYTSFDWPGSQSRQNIYAVPDALGTTFTLRAATSDSDPTTYTNYGTLACTSINSPANGFCSGTLTLQGVSGSGKAVCLLSTSGSQYKLACAAQRPDVNTVPVSILASVSNRAVLAVSVSPAVAQVANTSSTTTITATLTNLSGRNITSLANPGGGLDLVAPFSNSGAYAGTGGTCGSSLAGFASCIVNITYAPSALGTHLQTFRVAYNHGSGTVNATASLVGTAGLSSITIDNPRPGHASNTTHTFTATATYSNGTTQDVSSAVTWASSSGSVATIGAATGVANFFNTGSSTLSATLGATSTTLSANVLDPTTYFGVLGQSDATSVSHLSTGSLSSPYGVASTGTKLFVSDLANHRVVVHNTLPTANGQAGSFSLCQGAFTKNIANQGGISASRCYEPLGVSTDGTRLALADSNNNRVLLWTTLPTTQGQAATYVLGQANFSTRSADTTSQAFNEYVPGVFVGSSKLLVADPSNSRVLIWSAIPTSNYQPASLVLGQTDFLSASAGITSSTFWQPRAVWTNGTKLYVADLQNSRVLIWNAFPTANGQAASAVLGQNGYGAGKTDCNRGGAAAANTLCYPGGVYSDGTKLYVADSTNNRVLVWNTLPSTTGKAADYVIGQANFTDTGSGAQPQLLNNPVGMAVNGTKLFIADPFASRVVVFNTIPTASGASADVFLGHRDGYGYWANDLTTTPSAAKFGTPKHFHSDGKRVFLGDWTNHRILIWNSFPTANNQAADLVLGQANFTDRNTSCTATGLSEANSVFSTGSKLLVSDYTNSRILIYNSMPTVNNQVPSLVLGQTDFTTCTGTATASGLDAPVGAWTDGRRVTVADVNNQRILIWTTFPTANGQPANIVIGQPDMTSRAITSPSSTTLLYPTRAIAVGSRFFVADSANSRILAWNTFPTVNNQPADYVLGQPDFTTADWQGCGSCISSPEDIFSDGVRLMAAGYTRLVTWNTIPTVTNQAFSSITGQLSVYDNHYNMGDGGTYENPTGTGVSWPNGVWSDGIYTFLVDSGNARVLALPPASSFYATLALSDGPTYAFGAGNVGTTANKTITVSNSGSQTAYALGVGQALAAPFYFKGGTYPGTGGTCGTSLAGGASCTLVVSFLPTAPGNWTGTNLELTYRRGDGGSAATASLLLSGSTTMSALTISDGATYNFGTVSGSTNKTFTISNPGNTKTTLMRVATPMSAPYGFLGGQFPGTGGTCTTVLSGGASCTVVVNFNPTSTGTFNSTVSLNYTDAASVVQTLSRPVTGTK